jgi:hypothetical protein
VLIVFRKIMEGCKSPERREMHHPKGLFLGDAGGALKKKNEPAVMTEGMAGG